MKKNVKQESLKKIKLTQLVWMGFNYVLGVGFLITILKVLNYTNIHSIWILLLTSLVVAGAALAFMRNAQTYSEVNGGASEYNKRTFGPFMGWLVGFFQWTLGPIGASVNILILIEFSLSGIIKENIWGENTKLFLRLISILVFLMISLVAIVGLKQFKIVFNIVSIIKWVLMFTILMSAIIIIIKSNGQNYLNVAKYGNISTINFNSAFLLFFYAFSGFENFVVIARNVENPKKSMSKAIVFSLVGAGLFYIISLILIMGTIEQGQKLEELNVINLLIVNAFGFGALFLGASAQMISRITTDLQNPIYGGAFLQGMAEQKYLPKFLKDINYKNNLPQKAMLFNLFTILLFSFIWLILPYLTNIKLQTIESLISIYSIVTLFLYSTVIVSAIKLLFTKKIVVKFWEPILWIISLGFLIFQTVVYFIQFEQNLGGIVTLSFLLAFSIIWYFTYIKRQQKMIIVKNEKI